MDVYTCVCVCVCVCVSTPCRELRQRPDTYIARRGATDRKAPTRKDTQHNKQQPQGPNPGTHTDTQAAGGRKDAKTGLPPFPPSPGTPNSFIQAAGNNNPTASPGSPDSVTNYQYQPPPVASGYSYLMSPGSHIGPVPSVLRNGSGGVVPVGPMARSAASGAAATAAHATSLMRQFTHSSSVAARVASQGSSAAGDAGQQQGRQLGSAAASSVSATAAAAAVTVRPAVPAVLVHAGTSSSSTHGSSGHTAGTMSPSHSYFASQNSVGGNAHVERSSAGMMRNQSGLLARAAVAAAAAAAAAAAPAAAGLSTSPTTSSGANAVPNAPSPLSHSSSRNGRQDVGSSRAPVKSDSGNNTSSQAASSAGAAGGGSAADAGPAAAAGAAAADTQPQQPAGGSTAGSQSQQQGDTAAAKAGRAAVTFSPSPAVSSPFQDTAALDRAGIIQSNTQTAQQQPLQQPAASVAPASTPPRAGHTSAAAMSHVLASVTSGASDATSVRGSPRQRALQGSLVSVSTIGDALLSRAVTDAVKSDGEMSDDEQ